MANEIKGPYLKSLSQIVDRLKDKNDAHEDSAGKKRWRKQRVVIQMALPSSQIHKSDLGTALSRKAMTKERSKKLNAGDDTEARTRRPKTAGAVELKLRQEMQKRGIKVNNDEDGDESGDELDRLQQIDIVREMPVSIKWKRAMRDKLYEMIPDRKESWCAAWRNNRKVKLYLSKKKGRKHWNEVSQYFQLWGSAMTKIEGNHGAGVLTYFMFLRWLFLVNIVIFLCTFMFIVIPQVTFPAASYSEWLISNTSSPVIALVDTCSANYLANISIQTDFLSVILSFAQGTGWMENTIMFQGYYVNKMVSVTSEYAYNIPLAYMLVLLFYLLFSLILIVRKTSSGFKERLFTTASASHQFCNLLFGIAWDHSIAKEDAAKLRHKCFGRNVVGEIEERRRQARLKDRTMGAKCKLYTIRFLTNFIVFGTLCGAGYLIYFTTIKTVELSGNTTWYDAQTTIVRFLIQYMTSMTITGLNAVLPPLYKLIVRLEDFGTGMSISITLFRTVFLKLASLTILLISIITEITCSSKDECRVGTGSCNSVSFTCWETKIGQEIYKLVLMDFFVLLGIAFGVELPRWLVATKCRCKLLKRQEFDVAKEVLNIIYSETLLWLGAFFSPMIPVIVVAKNIIRFYIRYMSSMVFYGPSSKPYSSSDSDAFFMYVLLCAYILCVVPIGYCIWMIPPSRGCGPFRLYDNMYDIFSIVMSTWPAALSTIIKFTQSSIFELTAIVILAVAIYYLAQIVNAYTAMMRVLKEQLVLGNYDKKFLLEKLHEISGVGIKPVIYKSKELDENNKRLGLNPVLPIDVEC